MIRWGVDLGGTKIEAVVIHHEGQSFQTLARKRIPTESHLGYRHVLSRIAHLIELLKQHTGLEPTQLGIGTPGSIDPSTGLLKNSNSQCLNSQPILDDLKELLQIPIALANDANCFALAETRFGGVAQGYPSADVVFGIIMGTGVGGGLVINQKVINGANGITGEWGHNYLDTSGGDCYCGKVGCVETILSGPALERYYQSLGGQNISLREIISNRFSDDLAMKTTHRLIHYFGLAVSTIVNVLDPDVIVIGGGVGNIDLLYDEGKESLLHHVFNPECSTKILKPQLGDSAGVIGAALLD